jgi:CRP-like cAMP-binding protein
MMKNALLAALPAEEYERLRPRLETVSVKVPEGVYEPGEAVPHVFFPRTGVFSLVTVMPDGATVEFATVGNEGMVGLPVFLGAETMPSRCFCQIESSAERMEAAAFREEVWRGGAFHELLHRYTQALFNQVAQSAACNRLHSIDERCARWLLMTHDRVAADRFDLTQQFLSQMLGVRRPSVSTAAGILQKAGLIQYSRGRITILDRPGLEAASCECYGIIRAEFDRLVGR